MGTRAPSGRRSFAALPVVTGICAAASWGLSTVLSKQVLITITPSTLLLLQLAVSTLALWIGVVIRHAPLPKGRAFFGVSLPALLQPGLAYSLGIIGLALTMVSVETVLWATEPLFVLALAWLLLKEKVSLLFLVLILLAFLGVILVSVTGPVTVGGDLAILGNGLILLGSLCAALYTLVTRRMIHERDPLVVATLHHTGGLVWAGGVLIIGLLWGGVPALRAFPPHVWALAAISGLGQYALPFWLYVITLKYLPTSRASLFLILIPVCSIGGAALFLGERLTVVQWIGASLILIMVISLVVSSSWEGQQKNSNV